jgi:diguanylate cyclase (GGDEF)-like protein
MFRGLIKRFGSVAVTAAATVWSIFFSIGLVVVLDLLLKPGIPREDVIIGAVIPALLAPLMLYGFVRLSQQLDGAEARLRALAAEDPLTGILNRRRFLELADLEWVRAQRHGRPQSLLLIDVDEFKAVNDRHGHLSGDETLRRIAETCQSCLRRTDVLGRYGGDEFVILLPETEEPGAVLMAERIRRALAACQVKAQAGPVRITVSIGAAARRIGMEAFDSLLAQADAALYTAKSKGRNRIETVPTPRVPEATPTT